MPTGLVCQRNAVKSDHQEFTVYYSYVTHIHYMYNVYPLLCIHIQFRGPPVGEERDPTPWARGGHEPDVILQERRGVHLPAVGPAAFLNKNDPSIKGLRGTQRLAEQRTGDAMLVGANGTRRCLNHIHKNCMGLNQAIVASPYECQRASGSAAMLRRSTRASWPLPPPPRRSAREHWIS